MHIWCQRLTKVLKAYDRDLYAEPVSAKRRRADYDETIHSSPWEYVEQVHIKRHVKRLETYWLDKDTKMSITVDTGEYLFALTRDWTMSADRVDWGIEPVMAKIRDMDIHYRGGVDLFDEAEKSQLKGAEAKERARKNVLEDGLREMHPIFKKNTNDVNTALFEDPRRKKQKTRSY